MWNDVIVKEKNFSSYVLCNSCVFTLEVEIWKLVLNFYENWTAPYRRKNVATLSFARNIADKVRKVTFIQGLDDWRADHRAFSSWTRLGNFLILISPEVASSKLRQYERVIPKYAITESEITKMFRLIFSYPLRVGDFVYISKHEKDT